MHTNLDNSRWVTSNLEAQMIRHHEAERLAFFQRMSEALCRQMIEGQTRIRVRPIMTSFEKAA